MKIIVLPLEPVHTYDAAEIVLNRYISKGYRIVSSTSLETTFYCFKQTDKNGHYTGTYWHNLDSEVFKYLKEINVDLINYNAKVPAIIYTLEQSPVGKVLYEDS